MKPVVSSLVALALAIAPLSAFAKPTHKTPHAKVVKNDDKSVKADKSEKSDKAEKTDKVEKSDKADKSEKAISRVKAGKKDGAAIKNVAHHAHNVDLSGAGHKEPKTENGVLVPASMKVASTHASKAHAKPVEKKNGELPKLPNPNAGKPSKGGAEKGAARKPAEKKADSGDDVSGEPTRDEDFAELVARIRGHHTPSVSLSENEEKGDDGAGKSKNAKVVKNASHKSAEKAPPCSKDPVEIVRGPEVERFELTKCDGKLAPLAVERLSILVRPGSSARPTTPLADLAKKSGADLAPGVRRVDARLVERIQAVVDHFGKPGSPAKLSIISGYRPASVGSMHSSGRAIDFRVEGARNEDVVAFCKTLNDTGCGFYPNSSFVHIDVRDSGSGHVTWIDASGPGETPRYVPVWPPPAPEKLHRASAKERAETSSNEDLAAEGESLLRARRVTEHSEQESDNVDEHPAAAEKQP